MTLIAASIAVDDVEEIEFALQRAANAVKSGAQLIEWRIDALAEEGDSLSALKELVNGSPVPCIVTCRIAQEGGEYHGDEPSRADLFEQLLQSDAKPRYIDVEWSAMQRNPKVWRRVRELLASDRDTKDLHTGLILSTHDFTSRPPDLLQRLERMSSDPLCSIVKVAWHARSLRDNLEAFDLLRDQHKPLIALCMGPFGLMSRVLAPKFGGFLTFAVDREMEVTAPGQPTIGDLKNLYSFDHIGPQTRVYGVIGWPVTHSQSPAIHNAGYKAIGFDGVYLPLPIPPEYEHFKATVGSLIDHQGLNFRGASVTIPHKENLLRFVKERGGRIDPRAERIGAANTLIVGSAAGSDGLECTNTDYPASIQSLCDGMNIDRNGLANKRIAVIGAGGVARAVIEGLIECGANVSIFNRNSARAERLSEELSAREAASGSGTVGALPMVQLFNDRFDVVINCTPIGMSGGPAPNDLPWHSGGREARLPVMDDSTTVFDTVYSPSRTPMIQEAESRGARTITGVDMFVRQAAMQFEKWTGVPGPRSTFEHVLSHTAQPA